MINTVLVTKEMMISARVRMTGNCYSTSQHSIAKVITNRQGGCGGACKAMVGRTIAKQDWDRFFNAKYIQKPTKASLLKTIKPRIEIIEKQCIREQKLRPLINSPAFYLSRPWRELRVKVIEKYDCKCMMCGRSPKHHGISIHVDHIKPRSKFPELSLEISNLQLLCEDCNIGKSNRYDTDHRPDALQDEVEIILDAPVTMQ